MAVENANGRVLVPPNDTRHNVGVMDTLRFEKVLLVWSLPTKHATNLSGLIEIAIKNDVYVSILPILGHDVNPISCFDHR